MTDENKTSWQSDPQRQQPADDAPSTNDVYPTDVLHPTHDNEPTDGTARSTEGATRPTAPTQALPPLSDTAVQSHATGGQDVDPAYDTSEDSAESPDGPYRPAPQYGAYGPVPEQVREQQRAASQPPVPPQNQSQQPPLFGLPFQNQNQGQHQQMPAGARPQQSTGQVPPTGGQVPNWPPYGDHGDSGKTPEPRQANGVLVGVVSAIVTAALCLGLGYMALTSGWVNIPRAGSSSSLTSSGSDSNGTAVVDGSESPDWVAVSKKVSSSVVSIQTTLADGEADGSGVIINKEGYVLTNNHVVSGGQSITVTLSNGDIYKATVKGTDATTDLAVLKIENAPSDLNVAEFADSDDLAVGEPIMAIGNPLGYTGTTTTGIVSALNRPVSVMSDDQSTVVTNAVQIDAAINPGNSGGPTFNAAGQVIGINSSIATTATSSDTAGSIGIGFAIPSSLAKRVAQEIIQNGKVEHVALGVTITTGQVSVDGATRDAVIVQSVNDNSPAAKAGIRKGDAIIGFNGVSVENNYSLLGFVRAAAMDSTAKLTIVRDGKTMEVDVKLDQAEAQVNGTNRSEEEQEQDQQDYYQQFREWLEQQQNR
ncbi:S1C family serine protease [Bifidobacterium cuniculi]|uniref:S1C family serine protease n=1 Tax=Bifidobacterium cuniculi TaxID=1688 RepID=UPI00068AB997|nr:trypsin-like peptidase domain-containing protein [Bifidobacterium cuniculi]